MAARTQTLISANTSLKQLKKAFPDIEGLLRKIGYAPVTRMMTSMSSPDNIPLSNIARAAGLTEIEIALLVEELNERLSWGSPGTAGKTRTEPKAKAKAKTKVKTKAKSKAKIRATKGAQAKGRTGARAKGKAKAKRPKRRAG